MSIVTNVKHFLSLYSPVVYGTNLGVSVRIYAMCLKKSWEISKKKEERIADALYTHRATDFHLSLLINRRETKKQNTPARLSAARKIVLDLTCFRGVTLSRTFPCLIEGQREDTGMNISGILLVLGATCRI